MTTPSHRPHAVGAFPQLTVALCLTLAFMCVEFYAGWLIGSLSLLADHRSDKSEDLRSRRKYPSVHISWTPRLCFSTGYRQRMPRSEMRYHFVSDNLYSYTYLQRGGHLRP